MFSTVFPKITRLIMAAMILAGMLLALPKPAQAAFPTFDIVAVQAGDSVTIRTHNYPANVQFTVRMDVSGNLAIGGTAVALLNSGTGGSFEATFQMPVELKSTRTIAIRMDSAEGYYAYNWFSNITTDSVPQPIPVTGSKPRLTVSGVKPDTSVVVEVRNMPAYTTLTVRVGPYYTFFNDYVITPSVRTDGNGYVKFTVALPSVVKGVELVTVRVDGGGARAFNAFKNVTGGTTPSPSTACSVVSVTPVSAVNKNADFDLVWTLKNTSANTWDGNSVDYKYVSGAKFYKRGSSYDLHQTIKPGETVKVIVDVIAPSTAGYYTTNWALVQGSTTLCTMSATLRVK